MGTRARNEIIPLERIQNKIYLIRGQKVMLDVDIAAFYHVETGAMNRVVRRNIERFPEDFMFVLSIEEVKDLRCQIGSSRASVRGGRRYFPLAFTEQGVAMLSGILKSDRAVAVSVQIMRSFVKLRELLLSNVNLAKQLKTLESRTDEHARLIVQIIHELQKPISPKTRRIGF